LRATTKKGRQLFAKKKCTPGQNPGYAYMFRGNIGCGNVPGGIDLSLSSPLRPCSLSCRTRF